MKIELDLPLKDVLVTQYFGKTKFAQKSTFYTSLGLDGHNGVDFYAKIGMPVKACHSGIVTWAGTDGGGGISVTLASTTKGLGYKTIYYHLSVAKVKNGDRVNTGDIIGLAGNSGKYTTGPHLHLGLKWMRDGVTINYNNGYKGAINPSQYMPNNWDKPNAYHRYYRKGSLLAEVLVRFKNPWLHRQLKKRNKLHLVYDNIFINKITYGGWSFLEAIDDGLNQTTAYLKKSESKDGQASFSSNRE